jgi:DNA-binding NtrC family response regulator
VNTTTRRERWLLIDDSQQDAELLGLAIGDLGADFDLARDLKSAEVLLKKNDYDFAALDYLFKNTKQTGDELLPSLRAALPRLPVIAISSSEDPEIPARVIQAGADVFIPKVGNCLTMMKLFSAASRSALAIRRLKQRRESSTAGAREIYLEERNRAFLAMAAKRRMERVAIVGVPGTGRTSTARLLAREFLLKNFGGEDTRPVITLSCAALDESRLDVELFGESLQRSDRIQLTAFERANGGVLILDDIDALPASLQRRLKESFESLDAAWGSTAMVCPKIIATMTRERMGTLDAGFLGGLSHRIMELPSVAELREVDGFLRYLEGRLGVRFHASLTEHLKEAMIALKWHHEIAGFVRCIQRAALLAQEDDREVLGPTDFSFHMDAEFSGVRDRQGISNQVEIAPHEIKLQKLILRIQKGGGTLEEARDDLRELMIHYTLERNGGNKKRAAEELGVSRQTVYGILG